MNPKKELVDCVKGLYAQGLTSSVSGNHSIRAGKFMWITPSGLPRYRMRPADLARVDLKTGKASGKARPSIELDMHRRIYNVRPDVNAIVHTHSPFTIGVSVSAEFRHVIEEARLVVGDPAVIANKPSGSTELAQMVENEFQRGFKAVVVKNHGVVAGGPGIHEARAMVESLEDWAKILTVARIFGGAHEWLD